jgi:hypothetical protein
MTVREAFRKLMDGDLNLDQEITNETLIGFECIGSGRYHDHKEIRIEFRVKEIKNETD